MTAEFCAKTKANINQKWKRSLSDPAAGNFPLTSSYRTLASFWKHVFYGLGFLNETRNGILLSRELEDFL